MAVQEDDLGSEQTLEKTLEPTNVKWENGSAPPRTKSFYLAAVHIRGYKCTQPNLKAWNQMCNVILCEVMSHSI